MKTSRILSCLFAVAILMCLPSCAVVPVDEGYPAPAWDVGFGGYYGYGHPSYYHGPGHFDHGHFGHAGFGHGHR